MSVFTPAAIAQETMRTLTVTGRGSESAATTRAKVTLGVEITGKTAEEVQQEVARRASAVVDLLRSRSVSELETTGLRLNPQYSYENGRSELVGYQGVNTVSFKVPTAEAGPLIDEAVAAGATQVQGIEFMAEDEAIATAQEVALREATQSARRQADAVFDALGFTAREIVSIQINGANVPMPLPVAARLEAANADVSTPVIGGEQTVEATVTLQISY
ncbi:hypothetical protein C7271_04680 [filamentous cyanobacterium CCP5]|nr:hypothetical protein C7271_04680 [filamentous cyanobacterium CCP5]